MSRESFYISKIKADKIRKCSKIMKSPLKEIALSLNITPEYLSLIMNGKRKASKSLLERINIRVLSQVNRLMGP